MSQLNAKSNQTAHSIRFLNNILNRENMNKYVLTRSFELSEVMHHGKLPLEINEHFKDNKSYRRVLEDYFQYRKTIFALCGIFMVLAIFSIFFLIREYPEYLMEVFENGKKQ